MLTETKSQLPFYTCELPPSMIEESNKLMKVSEAIAQATIKWMTLIAQNAQDALQNYTTDNTYLKKNMWYPEDLWKACEECKQPEMIEYIKIDHKQVVGFVPTNFFDKIVKKKEDQIHIQFEIMEFLVKPEVQPSKALKAVINGHSILDCGVACQIARYGALRDVLGKTKFNKLFSSLEQPMNIGFANDHDPRQPMKYFVKFTQSAYDGLRGYPGNRPVKTGQLVYFEGVKCYSQKYPLSSWGGVNTFCINNTSGQQTFIFFGGDPKGNTEKEINQLLHDHFHKNENPYLTKPDNIDWINLKKISEENAPENVKEKIKNKYASSKVEGFSYGSSQEFIVELIEDLVKLPLEEVSMDFVKNHRVNKDRFKPINQNFTKK